MDALLSPPPPSLQPSLPAVPLEAFYIAPGSPGALPPGSRVASAPTFIPGAEGLERWGGAVPYPYPAAYAWTSAIALNVVEPFTVSPTDFSPPLVPGGLVEGFVVSRLSPGLNATRTACADGAPAAGCAQPFSAAAPVVLLTGPPPEPRAMTLEVLSFAPVFQGGWALVGGECGCTDDARFDFSNAPLAALSAACACVQRSTSSCVWPCAGRASGTASAELRWSRMNHVPAHTGLSPSYQAAAPHLGQATHPSVVSLTARPERKSL